MTIRHLKLMLFTIACVMALAAVVVFSLKPTYTASALVLVDTSAKNLLDPTADAFGQSSDSARVDSEVELAKSDSVLMRVIDDQKLMEDPAFASQPNVVAQVLRLIHAPQPAPPSGTALLDETLRRLDDAVNVERVGLTFLITIQARADTPEAAARIANGIAQAYIKEQLQSKINSIETARSMIESRLPQASASVASSEEAVDGLIDSNVASIAQETGRPDLVELQNQINSQNASTSQLTALVQSTNEIIQQRDWDALSKSLQSQEIAALQAQHDSLKNATTTTGITSASAQDLRSQLAKVDASLADAARSKISNLQTEISSTQGRVSDLKNQLRSEVLSSNLSSTAVTQIYELQQTAEIARTQYQTLLTRLKEMDQQSYLQVADSRVASLALPPDQPSFPNPRLLFSLAAITALALGVGIVLFYDSVVGGVLSEEQLKAVVGSRTASSIPRQRQQARQLSLADAVIDAPLSIFAEALRRLRLRTDQAVFRNRLPSSVQRGQVIVVCSAAPGEGKTTIALSLARTYAISGKSTLLVDCDLRKPSVMAQAGLTGSGDLLAFFAHPDNIELDSVIVADRATDLHVLGGTRQSETSTDQLFADQAFAHIMQSVTRAFDIVVLDTPPIGPVVDGVYLARYADSVLLVAKWAETPQGEIRAAAEALLDGLSDEVEVLAVLNQVSLPKSRHSSKYASYYSRG